MLLVHAVVNFLCLSFIIYFSTGFASCAIYVGVLLVIFISAIWAIAIKIPSLLQSVTNIAVMVVFISIYLAIAAIICTAFFTGQRNDANSASFIAFVVACASICAGALLSLRLKALNQDVGYSTQQILPLKKQNNHPARKVVESIVLMMMLLYGCLFLWDTVLEWDNTPIFITIVSAIFSTLFLFFGSVGISRLVMLRTDR